jgi:hypothetical protein
MRCEQRQSTPKSLTVHPGGVELAGAPSQHQQQQGCQQPSRAAASLVRGQFSAHARATTKSTLL